MFFVALFIPSRYRMKVAKSTRRVRELRTVFSISGFSRLKSDIAQIFTSDFLS
jgi:hypothetical protein